MNHAKFLEELLSSYPQGLRPDASFLNKLKGILKKRNFPPDQLEEALTTIVASFRMFPTISEILQCIYDTHKQMHKNAGETKAYEYFTLNGIDYRREVEISSVGNVNKRPTPEGATNYLLVLPSHMRHEDKPISAEEAYRQGVLSQSLYDQFKRQTAKREYIARSKTLERFENIGKEIKQEYHEPVMKDFADYDDIDDSMAANPETHFLDMDI